MIPLEVRDLRKSYGGVCALDGVSFDLREGEVLAIMGPNGAGKTTLVDAITGRQRPDAGTVRFHGRSVTGSSLEANGRRGLVRTFQEAVLPADLTVLDYLQLGRGAGPFEWALPNLILPWAGARHRAARAGAAEWLARHGLGDRTDRPCSELSAGEQKLVHLLRALWRDPEGVLLLDEPTAGLAADQIATAVRLLREYVGRGRAVAVVSHDQDFVNTVADRVLHLSFGRGRVFERAEFAKFLEQARAARAWRQERFRPAALGPESVEVKGLTVARGSGYIVENVTFSLRAGDVLGIVGANGAGKSTLFKALLNIEPGRTGQVRLRGSRLDGLAAHDVARAGLGVVLQGGRVPTRLTVEAALRMAWQNGERFPTNDPRARTAIWHDAHGPDDLLARFPLLERRRRVPSGLLSGGEQMLLAVGLALARRPLALLLDEPSTGLQDQLLRDLLARLAELAGRGLTLAIIEQDVEALATISTLGIEIHRGRVVRNWAGASDTDPRPLPS